MWFQNNSITYVSLLFFAVFTLRTHVSILKEDQKFVKEKSKQLRPNFHENGKYLKKLIWFYLVFTYLDDNIFHLFIRVVTEIMFVKIVLFLPILKQSFGKSVPILETKNLILNNGHKMPFLGFSTFNWKASPSRMKDAVYEAIKIGYRYKLFSHTVC